MLKDSYVFIIVCFCITICAYGRLGDEHCSMFLPNKLLCTYTCCEHSHQLIGNSEILYKAFLGYCLDVSNSPVFTN